MGYDIYLFLAQASSGTAQLTIPEVIKTLENHVFNQIATRFNGFSVAETWSNTSRGYKEYFSIDNNSGKKIMYHADLDLSHGGQWSPFIGICSPTNTGMRPDGLTMSSVGRGWDSDWTWAEELYEYALGVYTVIDNSNNTLIGISSPQLEPYYEPEPGWDAYGDNHIMLLDRPKEMVYALGSAAYYSNTTYVDTYVSAFISHLFDDLSQVGTFLDYSLMSYTDGYAVEHNVLYKDILNNMQQYKGSIPMKSYYNSNWYDGSERIKVANKKYFRVGYKTYFIPYDNYTEILAKV